MWIYLYVDLVRCAFT